MNRRNFMKLAGMATAGAAVATVLPMPPVEMGPPDVWMTPQIPEDAFYFTAPSDGRYTYNIYVGDEPDWNARSYYVKQRQTTRTRQHSATRAASRTTQRRRSVTRHSARSAQFGGARSQYRETVAINDSRSGLLQACLQWLGGGSWSGNSGGKL